MGRVGCNWGEQKQVSRECTRTLDAAIKILFLAEDRLFDKRRILGSISHRASGLALVSLYIDNSSQLVAIYFQAYYN